MFLKRIVIVFMAFVCNVTFAHNPKEVYYRVVATKEKQQLTIHFTPLAATNLLYYLKPELESKTEVVLASYLNEFETYFNKTIELTIDQQPIQFKLTAYELEAHEASLTFVLENLQTYDSEFEISISSFVSFEERIMNVIRVDLNGEKTSCILDKDIRTCSSTNKVTLTDYILVFVAIGLLVALVFFIRKKNSIVK